MKEKTGDYLIDRLLYWFVSNAKQVMTVAGVAICMLLSYSICILTIGISTDSDMFITIIIGFICGLGTIGLLDTIDIGVHIRSLHKYIGKVYYS
ncbi:MAG: hypothetical protein WC979_00120 [Candidatus Pacearchaeota archaeon]|jgi:hypothetical protein|nr:hypothetical protein [Clostridia bacterium]